MCLNQKISRLYYVLSVMCQYFSLQSRLAYIFQWFESKSGVSNMRPVSPSKTSVWSAGWLWKKSRRTEILYFNCFFIGLQRSLNLCRLTDPKEFLFHLFCVLSLANCTYIIHRFYLSHFSIQNIIGPGCG